MQNNLSAQINYINQPKNWKLFCNWHGGLLSDIVAVISPSKRCDNIYLNLGPLNLYLINSCFALGVAKYVKIVGANQDKRPCFG